jgi:hypothetical protein
MVLGNVSAAEGKLVNLFEVMQYFTLFLLRVTNESIDPALGSYKQAKVRFGRGT